MAEDRPDFTDAAVYQTAVDTFTGMWRTARPEWTPSKAEARARAFIDATLAMKDSDPRRFTVEYLWCREILTPLARGDSATARALLPFVQAAQANPAKLTAVADSRRRLALRWLGLSTTGDGLEPADAAVWQFGRTLLTMMGRLDTNSRADRELAAHAVDDFDALTKRAETIRYQLTHGPNNGWAVEFLERTVAAVEQRGGDARQHIAGLPALVTRYNPRDRDDLDEGDLLDRDDPDRDDPGRGTRAVRRILRGIRTGETVSLGWVGSPPEPQPDTWAELTESFHTLTTTVMATTTPHYGMDLMMDRARARFATQGLVDALYAGRNALTVLGHQADRAQKLGDHEGAAAALVENFVAETLLRNAPSWEPTPHHVDAWRLPTTPVDHPYADNNIMAVLGLNYLRDYLDLPRAPEGKPAVDGDADALVRRWSTAEQAYRRWAAAAPKGSANHLTRDGDTLRTVISGLEQVGEADGETPEAVGNRLYEAQRKAAAAADIQGTGARVYEVGLSLGYPPGQSARDTVEQQVALLPPHDGADAPPGVVSREAVSKAFDDLGPSPADAPYDQQWTAFAQFRIATLLNQPDGTDAWRTWARQVARQTTALRRENGPGLAAVAGLGTHLAQIVGTPQRNGPSTASTQRGNQATAGHQPPRPEPPFGPELNLDPWPF